MKLVDIEPALGAIENRLSVVDLRAHTYLASYPEILAYAESVQQYTETSAYHLSLLVYGWMPRVLRMDSCHIEAAVSVLNGAVDCHMENYKKIDISSLAECLHSVVGASKMLHFVKPNVFPIWDSKIQAFRGKTNGYNEMAKTSNYFEYVEEVHRIMADPSFSEFKNKFDSSFSNRLVKSKIKEYSVGSVRAIEAAAFELA